MKVGWIGDTMTPSGATVSTAIEAGLVTAVAGFWAASLTDAPSVWTPSTSTPKVACGNVAKPAVTTAVPTWTPLS